MSQSQNATATAKIQLDRLIRARYPVIAIASYEEARVVETIRAIAQSQKTRASQRGKTVVEWAFSTGLRQIEPAGDAPVSADDTRDPVAALATIRDWGQISTDPTIFVVKDLHNFTQAPDTLRFVRDIASSFQTQPCTLILLSPTFASLPSDWEKDVTLFDFPLPTAEELGEIVSASENSLPASIRINLANGTRERITRALSGMTAHEARGVLSMAVITNRALDESALPVILAEKKQAVRKSGYLEYFDTDTSAADIGGQDLLKRYASMRRAAFSDEARAYGLEAPKGYILVGPPGTGKSLSAKASTGGIMPLLRLDIGSLMGSLVGQSESNARNALKLAEAIAPCVLWIDEIEKAFAGMAGGGDNDSGVGRRMLGTILTWMQERTAPVYVVATANDVTALPPELLSRFDDMWWVDLPTASERAEIVSIHLKKRGRNPENFDLDAIARASEGFVGRELEKAVVAALNLSFFDGQRELTTDDLTEVLSQTAPVSQTMKEKIEAVRNWGRSRARPASSAQIVAARAENRTAALEL